MEKNWRYTGPQCLNSFVLTNIELIETPTLQDAIKMNLAEYENILKEQIFLQDNGVSFSYTDSISFYERQDIILSMIDYLEEKNKKIEEASKNAKKQ